MSARFRLELVDVYGKRIAERVDIYLRGMQGGNPVVLRDADARRALRLTNLARGTYQVYIDPPSYLPVSAFVNIPESGEVDRAYVFPTDVQKVIRVRFPAWNETPAQRLLEASTNVLGFEGSRGETLYNALDDIRRAGLLNIVAKTARTGAGGAPVLDRILELRELRGDRFLAVVPRALREDVKNAVHTGAFHEVSGALHTLPPGFEPAGSYKTPDRYGNLQLTFFACGGDCLADIDIDDANGFEHVFQVLRNSLTSQPTHPYNIQQILIRHQEVDPGYELIVRE